MKRRPFLTSLASLPLAGYFLDGLVMADVNLDADTINDGEIIKAYSGIYVDSNSAEVTIAAASVDWSNKVQVEIFDTDMPALNLTPRAASNADCGIDQAGDYLIFVTGNGLAVSSAIKIQLGVFKNNGATQLASIVAPEITFDSATDVRALATHGVATLAVDDTIEVWVQNMTNTDNILLQELAMSLIKLS